MCIFKMTLKLMKTEFLLCFCFDSGKHMKSELLFKIKKSDFIKVFAFNMLHHLSGRW